MTLFVWAFTFDVLEKVFLSDNTSFQLTFDKSDQNNSIHALNFINNPKYHYVMLFAQWTFTVSAYVFSFVLSTFLYGTISINYNGLMIGQ